MYTVSATYLNADPRTTLKTLNCLTSPANDQPNLGKPNEMLSFRSVESTASTFTVEIEGEKRQQQKQISIFFTYRYTNRKAAAASLYSCRKPCTPSRTRHTLLSNQPHYVSHNPYGSVHICTPPGRQPGSLPPSLAPVCLSRSLSLPPPTVCKHPMWLC